MLQKPSASSDHMSGIPPACPSIIASNSRKTLRPLPLAMTTRAFRVLPTAVSSTVSPVLTRTNAAEVGTHFAASQLVVYKEFIVEPSADTWDKVQALILETIAAATREASLKLIRLRHEHGVTSELDVRLAESLTEAARATLAQQQRQRALDENALTLVLGQPLTPEQREQRVSHRLAQVSLPELPAGAPSDLLASRTVSVR